MQELNTKKIIDTGYSFGFFVVAARFFFKGKPDTSHKPRQRARLIVGILIQLLALILPIVVSVAVHCSTQKGLDQRTLQGCLL